MNDAITCEKCGYDLFMINPDGLTVCNQCGEFSTVPNVPPAIDDETKRMVLELCANYEIECDRTMIPGDEHDPLVAAVREKLGAGK